MMQRSFSDRCATRPLLCATVLAFLLALPPAVSSHQEIQAQIDALDLRLMQQPGDAGLLMKRGDLYRRHGDFPAAERDFLAAEQAQPVAEDLAFFRGRLQLDAGQPATAEQSFSRYLNDHPSQVKALILRAEARLDLRQPLAAAADYSRAIFLSESPAPELYRNNALSLVAAGEPQWPAARAVIDSGLTRFALEVSLLGLAVDIALAQDDLEGARMYFSRVPEAIRSLPQWTARSELLARLVAVKPGERVAALSTAREELLARGLQLH